MAELNDFEERYWEQVLYEPAHDHRLRRCVRYILTGENPEELTAQQLDHGFLALLLKRDYRLSDEDISQAFNIAERDLELELYGEA